MTSYIKINLLRCGTMKMNVRYIDYGVSSIVEYKTPIRVCA